MAQSLQGRVLSPVIPGHWPPSLTTWPRWTFDSYLQCHVVTFRLDPDVLCTFNFCRKLKQHFLYRIAFVWGKPYCGSLQHFPDSQLCPKLFWRTGSWLGQKVKGQAHSRQWRENLVNTIFHKTVKGISSNFGPRCIWVPRCAD